VNTYEFCADWVAKQAAGRPIRVLDYGCGAGRIVGLLRERGIEANGCDVFYEGGDYSVDIPAELLPSIRRMQGDAIPFEDASFDVVTSNQVFEHVENLDAVLAEIRRVLRPRGLLLSLFPDRSVWREGHCGIPFLHWFPKRSRFRFYYAAALRGLGLGSFKGDKSISRWSSDFCQWLDAWTYYRSQEQLRELFSRHFEATGHIEERWLSSRLSARPALAGFAATLPLRVQRVLVRKVAGMALVSQARAG
jgi:SAM-dependent methyltransferase